MNEPNSLPSANGVYVRAVVVSNRAKAFKRKDGTGISVVVETELATQPGVVVWSRYFDPKTDASARVEGEIVVEFPKLKEFQQVLIRAGGLRSDERTGQIVIKSGELVSWP